MLIICQIQVLTLQEVQIFLHLNMNFKMNRSIKATILYDLYHHYLHKSSTSNLGTLGYAI
jgi:hypothetical protein